MSAGTATRRRAVAAAFAVAALAGTGCRATAPAPAPVLAPAPALAPAARAMTAASPAAAASAAAQPPHPVDAVPDVTLRRADPPSEQLAFTVVIAPPLALAADLDDMSSALGVPAALGQSLIDALTSAPLFGGARITRADIESLDRDRPVTAVGLVGGGACVALTFRDTSTARHTLERLFGRVAILGPAGLVQLPSNDPLWAGVSSRTLFLAVDPDTILDAGALALELQLQPRSSQAAFTLYPRALAGGRRLRALLPERLSRETSGRPLTPAARGMLRQAALLAGELLDQTVATRFSLDVDVHAGAVARLEIQPVPGSDLAKRASRPMPYELEAGLPITGDRTFVMASGSHSTLLAALATVVGATGPAGRVLHDDLNALGAMFQGAGSCAIDTETIPFRSYCSWGLVPGLKPARVLDRYAALTKASHAWLAELLGHETRSPKIRRTGDLLEIEEPVYFDEAEDPTARAMRKAALGGDTRVSAMTVRSGRLVATQGLNARALLAALAHPPPPRPPDRAPILEATLRRTKGADALLFADLISMVARVAQSADNPGARQIAVMMFAIPGLADLHAPMVFATRSADGRPSYELQLPYQTLENIMRIVRPFTGAMGAGQPAPAKRAPSGH
jgi:hypothetical protein